MSIDKSNKPRLERESLIAQSHGFNYQDPNVVVKPVSELRSGIALIPVVGEDERPRHEKVHMEDSTGFVWFHDDCTATNCGSIIAQPDGYYVQPPEKDAVAIPVRFQADGPRRRKPGNRRRTGRQSKDIFMDTTITAKVCNDPDDIINYAVKDGASSLANRQIVPQKIVFNIMPTLTNTAISGNSAENLCIQVRAINQATNEPVPAAPFRVISNINPSTFVLNFRRLGKVCPPVLSAYDSGSSTTYAQMAISGNQATNPRKLTIKATHYWRLLPQENIVAGPT
jgi:hypothetical protein